MYAVADRLDPETYLALARATYAEMALAGITCVGEFHYVHHQPGGVPYYDPNVMGAALIEAAAQAGVRLTLLDTCYLAGGIDEPLSAPSSASVMVTRAAGRPASTSVAVRAHTRASGRRSIRCVPCRSNQLGDVADWARNRAVPLHFHLSEQQAENEACVERYGVTPTRLLADSGALGAAAVAVHATHLEADDIALLAASFDRSVFVPDDRTRPRRWHRSGGCVGGRGCGAVSWFRWAVGDRPFRGGAGDRA